MKNISIPKKIFNFAFSALLATTITYAAEHRDCGGDYRLPGGVSIGLKHQDVERAGVILCKDYGQDDRIANDRYAIILGHDRNLNVWLPQAGKIESTHKYTSDTAHAELLEETGGLIDYSAGYISKLPYVYSGSKQLFFLHNSNDMDIAVSKITNSCKAAIANPGLPSCYKEIDEATAVSVVELLSVAQQIHNGTLGRQNTYTLYKRSQIINGQPVAIQIDGYYMRILGNRYNEVRQIFNQLFNVNIF